MSLIITNSQHYTNIANAIREKNGANTLYKPKEMSEALRALLFNKQLIERTIENLNDDTIISLGPYALAGCENLKSIELNNCTSIGVSAFLSCNSLENIILPEVSVIQRLGPCLFNLKIVNMPKLLEAPAHFLEDCSATNLIFPALQKANEGAFSFILNLKNIDFPSLTETGRSAFGGNFDLETANLPNLLTVGSYCFQEDSNLLTINAPKITTIAEYAFLNCGVKEMILPELINLEQSAFYSSYNLEKVDFPLCKTILPRTFSNCTSLKEVLLPEATIIYDGAFVDCNTLEEITLPKVQQLGSNTIGDAVFANCVKLKKVNIPSCTSLSAPEISVFSGCSALEEVDVSSLEIIPPFAFNGLQNLQTVISPNAKRIENYAFMNCSSLTDFNFSQVEYIGETAFQQTAISEITAPKCTYVGSYAFGNNSNLETVNFPNLTEINDSTFSYCTKLKNVNLPHVVSSRGPCAFMGASSLEELTLPSLNNLVGADFSGCTSLKKIDLPNVFAFFGHEIFWDCTSLETIILRYYSLVDPDQPSIVTLSGVPEAYFYNTPILDDPNKGFIYVPKVVEEYYKNYTNWNLIANKIRAIEDYPEILGGAE